MGKADPQATGIAGTGAERGRNIAPPEPLSEHEEAAVLPALATVKAALDGATQALALQKREAELKGNGADEPSQHEPEPEEMEEAAEEPQPPLAAPENPPEHVSFKTAFALPQPEPLPPPPPPPARREEPVAMGESLPASAAPKPGTAPFFPRAARPIVSPIPIAPRMTPRKPKLPVEEKDLAGGAEPKAADSLNGAHDPVLTGDPAAERHPTNVPEPKVEQPQAKLDPPIPAEDAQPSAASVVEVSPSPTPSGGDTPEPRALFLRRLPQPRALARKRRLLPPKPSLAPSRCPAIGRQARAGSQGKATAEGREILKSVLGVAGVG